MRKSICFLIILLVFPAIVHAETITYDICFSGCEYTGLSAVQRSINATENLSDKDIIINIEVDHDFHYEFGSFDNRIKSLVINGNNHTVGYLRLYADDITINGLVATQILIHDSDKIIVNNSDINYLGLILVNESYTNGETSLNETLKIDEVSSNNTNTIGLAGNLKIENMDFKNILVSNIGGTLNFYNCQFNKIINRPEDMINANIYNSTFESLRYKKITSETDYYGEFNNFSYLTPNYDSLHYDIYDLFTYSNTTVYFDKSIEMKSNETVDLTDYLDYYTEDKEIDYVIEDESVAKIDGLNLTGLKDGQTNITVTIDECHVVYRIKLTVAKEPISEKTIEVPITGHKIKLWVLLVIIILLVIISLCIFKFNKKKK